MKIYPIIIHDKKEIGAIILSDGSLIWSRPSVLSKPVWVDNFVGKSMHANRDVQKILVQTWLTNSSKVYYNNFGAIAIIHGKNLKRKIA